MKRRLKKSLIMASPFLLASFSCNAEIIPFDSDRWEFQPKAPGMNMTHEVKDYLGEQDSLYLRVGYALLKDCGF